MRFADSGCFAQLSGLLDVVMKQKTLIGEQTEIFDNMMLTMDESINSDMDLVLAPEYWAALGRNFVDDVRALSTTCTSAHTMCFRLQLHCCLDQCG